MTTAEASYTICPKCEGHGLVSDSRVCGSCHGTGEVLKSVRGERKPSRKAIQPDWQILATTVR